MAGTLAFFLSFLPRLAYLWVFERTTDPRANYYWELSESLLRHHALGFGGVKSTGFEPLYPFFLAFSRWATGERFFLVMTLQIALASLGAVFLYKLSFELSKSRIVAWTSTLLYSFYPYLIRQASSVIEVSILTTLLIGAAFAYVRVRNVRGAILCGTAFGLMLLLRIAVLPLWLLSVAAWIFRKQVRHALFMGGVTLLLLFPFGARNFLLDGSWLPSRKGLQLLVDHSPDTAVLIPRYGTDFLNDYAYALLKRERADFQEMSERAMDEFFTQKARAFMASHPGLTVKQVLKNLFYFFYPRLVPHYPPATGTQLVWTEEGGARIEKRVPRRKIEEGLYSISYAAILLGALGGIFRRRKALWKGDLFLLFTVLSFAGAGSFYEPMTRLRSPMDFVLMFYAACALEKLIQKIKPAGIHPDPVLSGLSPRDS